MPAVFSPDILISERFTESGFDDFRRAVVTVFEKVTVDTEGDSGGGMAKPPADGAPSWRSLTAPVYPPAFARLLLQ